MTDAFKALKPHNILPTMGALPLGVPIGLVRFVEVVELVVVRPMHSNSPGGAAGRDVL